jgi:hypothetical protein
LAVLADIERDLIRIQDSRGAGIDLARSNNVSMATISRLGT